MSRTMHHGARNRAKKFYWSHTPGWWGSYLNFDEPTPRKRKRHEREGYVFGRNCRGPGWWVNLTMNRPWRRAARKYMSDALDGLWEEDCQMPAHSCRNPDGRRRPHVYFF